MQIMIIFGLSYYVLIFEISIIVFHWTADADLDNRTCGTNVENSRHVKISSQAPFPVRRLIVSFLHVSQ